MGQTGRTISRCPLGGGLFSESDQWVASGNISPNAKLSRPSPVIRHDLHQGLQNRTKCEFAIHAQMSLLDGRS